MTGKVTIIRMIRRFEKTGPPSGQAFWRAALDIMGIPLLTPEDQIRNIPAEGPVVLVANHPHGLVDGMVLADLIGRRRTDFKILSRELLIGIDEVAASYMISVPFPHEPDAQRKSRGDARQGDGASQGGRAGHRLSVGRGGLVGHGCSARR